MKILSFAVIIGIIALLSSNVSLADPPCPPDELNSQYSPWMHGTTQIMTTYNSECIVFYKYCYRTKAGGISYPAFVEVYIYDIAIKRVLGDTSIPCITDDEFVSQYDYIYELCMTELIEIKKPWGQEFDYLYSLYKCDETNPYQIIYYRIGKPACTTDPYWTNIYFVDETDEVLETALWGFDLKKPGYLIPNINNTGYIPIIELPTYYQRVKVISPCQEYDEHKICYQMFFYCWTESPENTTEVRKYEVTENPAYEDCQGTIVVWEDTGDMYKMKTVNCTPRCQ